MVTKSTVEEDQTLASLDDLMRWFDGKDSVMVALSGGVDSALVAYAAFKKLNNSAVAVTADYKTLSREELLTAKRVCSEIGIRQILLDYNELENKSFVRNDSQRCFYCRMELGTRLLEMSRIHGIDTVVDGTHLDDLGEYRPGIMALRQNGIQSPLAELSISKPQIRHMAMNAGLSIYDKPSNSCLASRIPWGQRITAERLAMIESGEIIVKQLTNTKQVRVRDFDGSARIEIDKDLIPVLCGNNDGSIGNGHSSSATHGVTGEPDTLLDRITKGLKMLGFVNVEIDRQGYKSGNANVVVD